MSNTIIVLVPGLAGSTLLGADSVQVWPTGVVTLASLDEISAALAGLEGSRLYPGLLTQENAQTGSYHLFMTYFGMLKFNTATAQYTGPGTSAPDWGLTTDSVSDNALVAFPYDWRQDCTSSAKLLQNLLGTIQQLRAAASSPDYQLVLVGHSMGGLVCRAYLEKVGTGDPWFSQIGSLITLGTPHLGTPVALSGIMGQGIPLPPALAGDPELESVLHDFVNTSSSYSTYELLPPPVLEGASQPPFTQYIQDGSEWYNLLDADLPSEIDTAVTTAASQSLPSGTTDQYAQNLQSAAKFFQTLNYTGAVSGSTPALPPYYCVVGSGSTTVTGFLYDSATQTLQAQSTTDGDELVPEWSAAFTGRSVPVAGTYPAANVNHFSLPGAHSVQVQVAAWIGVEQQQAHAVREAAAAAV